MSKTGVHRIIKPRNELNMKNKDWQILKSSKIQDQSSTNCHRAFLLKVDFRCYHKPNINRNPMSLTGLWRKGSKQKKNQPKEGQAANTHTHTQKSSARRPLKCSGGWWFCWKNPEKVLEAAKGSWLCWWGCWRMLIEETKESCAKMLEVDQELVESNTEFLEM